MNSKFHSIGQCKQGPLLALICMGWITIYFAQAQDSVRWRSNPPVIHSSWDDLLEGVEDRSTWMERKRILRERYLKLLADEHKPEKPPLDLKVHETVVVEDIYVRKLISYQVETDERAHAYLGLPIGDNDLWPGIVALHGTYAQGAKRVAGLVDNPEKAYLDQLCRRGYVVIAPEHFVSGERIPEEGPYDTSAFHRKHPNWTAVGKFTYEHAIAIDVLETLPEVDPERIGALGHSLGGHGTFFLAAYDERIKAAAANCSASFFRHNAGVEHWARDHWYVYFQNIRNDLLQGKLPPIDFHEIIALIAPRAFLDLAALNDGDPLTQRQRALMNLKIMDVYELEGAPENFAFYMHGRGHSVKHESRMLMYAWMATRLKPDPDSNLKRLTSGFPKPVRKADDIR